MTVSLGMPSPSKSSQSRSQHVIECLNAHPDIVFETEAFNPMNLKARFKMYYLGEHNCSIQWTSGSSKADVFWVQINTFPHCYHELEGRVAQDDTKEFDLILTRYLSNCAYWRGIHNGHSIRLTISNNDSLETLPQELLAQIKTMKALYAELLCADFELSRYRWSPGLSRRRNLAFCIIKCNTLWNQHRVIFNDTRQLLSIVFNNVCDDVLKVVLQFVA